MDTNETRRGWFSILLRDDTRHFLDSPGREIGQFLPSNTRNAQGCCELHLVFDTVEMSLYHMSWGWFGKHVDLFGVWGTFISSNALIVCIITKHLHREARFLLANFFYRIWPASKSIVFKAPLAHLLHLFPSIPSRVCRTVLRCGFWFCILVYHCGVLFGIMYSYNVEEWQMVVISSMSTKLLGNKQ